MKNFVTALLATTLLIGCQQENENLDEFKSTQLSVNVEETTSELSYSGSTMDPAKALKADLWCDGELKSSLDFSLNQTVELFSDIADCKLILKEFEQNGRKFIHAGVYSEGIAQFEFRNAQNKLIDNRLVKANQEIGEGQYIQCNTDCEFKKVKVVFPFSVLNIEKEILENDVVYNQLTVGMEKENAPKCDDLTAKFIQNENYTAPHLQIKLSNCVNTIGTDGLEFGLDRTGLTNAGDIATRFLITDAHAVIDDSGVAPAKNGTDYVITLSLDEIKALWGSVPSTVEALTTDFVVAIRNVGGISALVYAIDNKCKIQKGK